MARKARGSRGGGLIDTKTMRVYMRVKEPAYRGGRGARSEMGEGRRRGRRETQGVRADKNYCEVDSERCGERVGKRTKAECRDVKQRPLEPTIAVFAPAGSPARFIPELPEIED